MRRQLFECRLSASDYYDLKSQQALESSGNSCRPAETDRKTMMEFECAVSGHCTMEVMDKVYEIQ